MQAALLDSQLATLGPLEADEAGMTVRSHGGVDATAETVAATLSPQK